MSQRLLTGKPPTIEPSSERLAGDTVVPGYSFDLCYSHDPVQVKRLPHSELLHHVLAHRPHASSLPVDIHRDRSHQAGDLDASDRHKHILRAVRFEPSVEEEREDESMEDVCRIRINEGLLRGYNRRTGGATHF